MTQENYWMRLRSRRITRRRLLRSASVAGVGAAGIALVGCGDDDDDDDQQAAPAAAQQAQQQAQQAAQQEQAAAQGPAEEQAQQQAVAQAAPKSGGTINNDATAAQQPHFDVHRASTADLSGWGAGPSYNGLLKSKPFDHGGATIVEPDLAASLPEVIEPATLVFTLRQGVKWFDIPPVNARTVTANDVDFSIKRQVAEGANASDLSGIASQEVVDDVTMSLTLADVNVDFLARPDRRAQFRGHAGSGGGRWR